MVTENKKQYSKIYREKNKDTAKKYAKEYRIKNLEKRRKQSKDWNKNNIEKHKISNKKYYMENKKLTATRTKKSNLKKYGITMEDYNQMFVNQNGLCAICNEKQIDGKSLFVDHNHSTGKVRGLLCHHCNIGIGFLKDDVNLLLSSIKYLQNNN